MRTPAGLIGSSTVFVGRVRVPMSVLPARAGLMGSSGVFDGWGEVLARACAAVAAVDSMRLPMAPAREEKRLRKGGFWSL